jgi:signal transduction histidine kinase
MAKVKDKVPVSRKSLKSESSRVRQLQTRLEEALKREAEALEQQTATGRVLEVMSSLPSDVRPVMETVVESAARLCGAQNAQIFQVDGETMRLVSRYGPVKSSLDAGESRDLTRGSVSGRTILDRQVLHILDLLAEVAAEYPDIARAIRREGIRTTVGVPLLREGVAIGAITAFRTEVRPFSDRQIALLQTFADQAVIAIENVRLFAELQQKNEALTQAHAQVSESLEQQTATSEILRVISRSPTDIQPVFDAVAESAARLCEAQDAGIFRRDGDRLFFVAHHGPIPFGPVGEFSIPLVRGTANGRSVLDAQTVHVADLQTEVHEFPEGSEGARRFGHRTFLIVPLMREGVAIGSISVRRTEAQLFTDRQVALLQTFADQAVIAIENVRLFTELESRNSELRVALDQQTATGEILHVISRSQTDVQPVFDTIVRSAVRLCDGLFSALCQFDGELLHQVAQHNYTPEALEEVHRVYPVRPSRGLGATRAILERAVVHIPDIELDPEFQYQALSRAIGFRSGLFVPMLREGVPLGVIVVARAEPGPFSDNEVELLKTFANQAVIAVENVRLFTELQARTSELTRSVDQLTALGEISQAVSSTLDVETVLQTIVSRASQLAGADGCAIYEYDDATEAFHIRATHNLDPVLVETLRAAPLRKGEGAMGRAAETREPTQVADIAAPGAYQSHIRDTLLGAGYRALLSVPLLREGEIIGSLSLNRHTPGEFPPEAIEVLKTFATQSALAIQNARLFREIADKSRQLEAASRHKSEFLANMSHELRTPLNAIIGFSEVLVDRMFGELNEKQDEYLKDIYASGQHLLSLINDILDLSKVEAGRMELEATAFDLPSAIDNALILVRERATRRGITLGRTIDEHLGMIRGDARKVKQVLLNLLSNALKFTPEGGRIAVSAGVHDDVAEVSVTDTGVGIAPEDQEAVFEEFRQVGTADKKAEGTGLGLALSRKFIELHGGRIWVKSEVGTGSTFIFTLPLTIAQ